MQDSPLCIKPPNLPPREEYLGPQQLENSSRSGIRSGSDRERGYLGDSSGRRTGTRTGNGDDIVLGPPRTSFPSTTPFGRRVADSERASRDSDGARDRLGFRSKNADGDGDGDRYRDSRNSNLRRRGDADQDSDGWSTVKPRKSFGHEGAEKFGRIGADRNSERRARERDDKDGIRDRAPRGFDNFNRDRDGGGDSDAPRRNGIPRARLENSWHKDGSESISQRERIEKSKNWRERDPDADAFRERDRDRDRDRGHDRFDRRWNRDRDQKQDAEPEWLDEPVDTPFSSKQAMNQEEFVKFMESLKKKDRCEIKSSEKPAESKPEPEPETSKITETSLEPILEKTDKFFEKFGPAAATPSEGAEAGKDGAPARPKIGATKGSRFTSFFTANRPTETPASVFIPAIPPEPADQSPTDHGKPTSDSEKVAFQMLLQKLQVQGIHHASSPPATTSFQEPPPQSTSQDLPGLVHPHAQHVSPDPYLQQLNMVRRDDTRRMQPPPVQIPQNVSPRPVGGLMTPSGMKTEQQIIQELVNQRQAAQSQGSSRHEQIARNSNAEFLMGLMQSARNAPEPQTIHAEELMGRQPQHNRQPGPQQPQSILQGIGGARETEFLRGAPQQRVMGRGPPGFLEEQFQLMEQERQQQPTHILQRPPPPGIEHLPPWMGPGGPNGLGSAGGPGSLGGPGGPPVGSQQHPGGPQRPMIPPPGLNGPSNNPRNAPPPGMGPNMFPPTFNAGPIHEPMAGPPPPRNMQPPPGFFGGPPFPSIPHPGMAGYQGGPDPMHFGGPAGLGDSRAMPPQFMRRP